MKLSALYSRIVKGVYQPERLERLSQEISETRENSRLNGIAIDSGDRALRNMSGMMRLLVEADGGKAEK